jgi:[FeFe] hydrogenase H-cluster maturation GTPase HydF
MITTPKNMRLHIGIFGRRNVGKSSILNAITGQSVSIVSEVAGTTTDPVEKPMELLPLGPVQFIDTAGLDDEGMLGELRMARTRQALDRVDIAIVVTAAGEWGAFENGLAHELRARNIPVIAAFNKCDLRSPEAATIETIHGLGIHCEATSAIDGKGIAALRQALIRLAPEEYMQRTNIVADLVPAGETCILVIPIDKEAPKGRIILPQVQALRDLLDHGCISIVVKDRELDAALKRLKTPPALVVTDSQAFKTVARITPETVPLTSFSILYARFLGDLETMVQGTMAITALKPGDRVLVTESCSHHPIEEDIGTVKIPQWLNARVGGALSFKHLRGHDFPADLSPYKLVIHCGACMTNRREVLTRIMKCRDAGVPITNYGLTIAYSLGTFERALGPFKGALEIYEAAKRERNEHRS